MESVLGVSAALGQEDFADRDGQERTEEKKIIATRESTPGGRVAQGPVLPLNVGQLRVPLSTSGLLSARLEHLLFHRLVTRVDSDAVGERTQDRALD